MATARRLLCGVGLAAALSGCATTGGEEAALAPPLAPAADPAPRAGAPLLFVAMPTSGRFQDVRAALLTEVERDFNVSTFTVTAGTTSDELGQALARSGAACAVLMNNQTVSLYRTYQSAHPEERPLPAVVVMTSFLDELRAGLTNVTGIAYEVPGVTAFVQLRAVIQAPLRRVGVVHRARFRPFIERQKNLASREQFELVPAEVGNDVDAAGLRAALHALLAAERVDALWMLNDNDLIRSSQFLDSTWRTELAGARAPLVVGVSNLVDPRSPLGSLAVVPDHEAMGLQTANLIFNLAESGWRADEHDIELPLSVKTVADLKQMRQAFGLKEDALRHIDKALE